MVRALRRASRTLRCHRQRLRLCQRSGQALAASDSAGVSAEESLGTVARRYRREKSEREAKQARAIPPASQFHLEIPMGALAEVAPDVVLHAMPHAGPHRALYIASSISPQVASHGASSLTTAVVPSRSAKGHASGLALRRDPFSR